MDLQLAQKEIEESLRNVIFPATPKELYEPISYILSLGGKRIRPLSVLMGCDLFSQNYKDAMPAALAIEILHNFTLLHDDIMDNAPIRRGQPTVHQKWNTNIAILSGDVMQSYSYLMLNNLPQLHILKIAQIISSVSIGVCEGQQMDMNFEADTGVTVEQYLKMIELKTSILLGESLRIGAIIGGAEEKETSHLYEFGKNIGIAFQIQDDILDVFGNREKVGKRTGGDIVSNKKTLLLLYAFELANKDQKKELKRLMAEYGSEDEKVNKTKEMYLSLGVKEKAQNLMHSFHTNALKELKEIAVSNDRKKIIELFFTNLLKREY